MVRPLYRTCGRFEIDTKKVELKSVYGQTNFEASLFLHLLAALGLAVCRGLNPVFKNERDSFSCQIFNFNGLIEIQKQ